MTWYINILKWVKNLYVQNATKDTVFVELKAILELILKKQTRSLISPFVDGENNFSSQFA